MMAPVKPQLLLPNLDAIPNLPGMFYTPHKENHHKRSIFTYFHGERIEVEEGVTHHAPRFVKTPRVPPKFEPGSLSNTSTRQAFQWDIPHHEIQPAWLAYDRHVLRFYVHTRASMYGSRHSFRSSDMTVLYYLEDDTMQISAPHTPNNGLGIFSHSNISSVEKRSACFLRRHRVPHTSGDYYTPESFKVGGVIEIYGRKFSINGCDNFTRYFYESHGTPQPANLGNCDKPDDQGNMSKESTPESPDFSEEKNTGGFKKDKMGRYMQNYHKVCRFYATVDDMTTTQFERRFFIFYYFLDDDTIKIRETYPVNSGRAACPIFYQRARVLKCPIGVAGPISHSTAPKHNDFINLSDFAIGTVIKVTNVSFYVYDADPWTRKYFKEEMNIELPPKIDMNLASREDQISVTRKEDVLADLRERDLLTGIQFDSAWNLMEPPIKCGSEDRSRILRFRARWSECEDEEYRRFIISYYLDDSRLVVNEVDIEPKRGLGIVPGKFLAKAVYENQLTKTFVKASDLLPGNEIMILNRTYTILEMDDHAKSYFETGHVRQKADLTSVLQKLGSSLRSGSANMRVLFRQLDIDGSSVLSKAKFEKLLRNIGYNLLEDEVLTVMRYFDKNLEGRVTFDAFCEVLSSLGCLVDEDEDPSVRMKNYDKAEYSKLANFQQTSCDESSATRDAMKAIGSVIHARPSIERTLIAEFTHLRSERFNLTRQVDPELIQEAFKRCGCEFDLADVQRVCNHLNPGKKTMEHTKFMQLIKASYHDFAARN
eukprot:GEMP01016962.1.p1 GENE.GEMP01016962.1~~GEMP01016962.1.p1  ORF type:complete len:780 (+),score=106.92 GEMP01016962.1:40-2340(+)